MTSSKQSFVCLIITVASAMASISVPLNQLSAYEALIRDIHPPGPASLPVANPSESFWLPSTPDDNPLAKEGRDGPLTEDADICIIGSGISGVSTAYHLSQMIQGSKSNGEVKAVILEARDFCSGATGRNGGHLTPFTYVDFKHHLDLYGKDQAIRSMALENYTSKAIVSFLEKNGLGDSVDLVHGKHMGALFTPEEEQSRRDDYKAAKDAGIDLSEVAWFTKEEMEKTHGTPFPGFRIPGHNLWPQKLVTHLFNHAKSANPGFKLSLHTSTPVTAVKPSSSSPNRRWKLETPRGSIHCRSVIHATNGYASHLLPHLTGPAGIIPVRGQIIALRAAVPANNISKSSWDANDGFEYWFPRPVNSSRQSLAGAAQATFQAEANPLVILGGGREGLQNFEIYNTDDASLNEDVGKRLKDFLPGIFPGKFEPGREPEMEWTGVMGFTKTGDPFVGPVFDEKHQKQDGQFITAGFSGHGMPRTYACSQAIAGMVLAELDGKLDDWKIPDWLPERYLSWSPLRQE